MSPGADGILEALERLQKGSFFHQGQICLTGGRGSGCQVAETVGPLPLTKERVACRSVAGRHSETQFVQGS